MFPMMADSGPSTSSNPGRTTRPNFQAIFLMQFRSRGFTVFEFLVVVVITAVVVIAMVLNSQYFLTQVRVMKVREEHALLQRALENYHLDYMNYPAPDQGLAALDAPTAYVARLPEDPFSQRPMDSYRYLSLPGVGHPWALISPGPDGKYDFHPRESWLQIERGMPQDPLNEAAGALAFAKSGEVVTAASSSDGGYRPISIADRGRRGQVAQDALDQQWRLQHDRAFRDYIVSVQYDPTNGTDSRGDIITLAPR